MKGENRWIWFLLGRSLVYALLGGVTCAIVGALVSATCGAFIGAASFPHFYPHSYRDEYISTGAEAGAFFGAVGGGVLGLVVFAVLGFVTPAKARLIPPRLFLVRASIGMVSAAIIALIFYFSVVYGISRFEAQSFERVLNDSLLIILFCGPSFMALGSVGGVVYGYRTLKARLLLPKAEFTPHPNNLNKECY